MLRILGNSLPELGVSLFGGLISSGSGGTARDAGLTNFLLSLILGAFCGLIVGLMVSRVLRFYSMASGRNLRNQGWPIYTALLGALLSGVIALVDQD